MAKILNFRPKTETVSAEGFLQDGDNTLSFQPTEEGGVKLGALPAADHAQTELFPRRDRDWTNQELADLFRVKRLLDAAGVPNEVERGLTDEGDPWFLFCRYDGEVFIHLCRLDGVYLLDSPNLRTPLRGADFNALIEDFTDRAIPRDEESAEPSKARVVKLERGGKVFLHPSALLAALIWTLFIASEDLVLLLPGADEDGDGQLDLAGALDFSTLEGGADTAILTGLDSLEAELGQIAPEKRDGTLDLVHQMLEDDGPHQRDAAQASLSQSGYAMGLSSIAIAIGILSETSFSDERNALFATLQGLGPTSESELVASDQDASTEAGKSTALTALLEGLDAFINGVDQAIDTIEMASAQMLDANGLTASEAIAATQKFASTLMSSPMLETFAGVFTQDDTTDGSRSEDIVLAEDGDTPTDQGPVAVLSLAALETTPIITLATIKQSFVAELHSLTIGDLQIEASLSLTEGDLETLGLVDVGGSQVAPEPVMVTPSDTQPAGIGSFDVAAQYFFNTMLNKSGDIDIIATKNQMIFIDMDAVSQGSIYAMSWQLDDGAIISLIGLQDDFYAFDMIA